MKPNCCPWCDSTASLASETIDVEQDASGATGETTYHFVRCDSCGARGPCVDREGNELIEQDAIERWNEVAP